MNVTDVQARLNTPQLGYCSDVDEGHVTGSMIGRALRSVAGKSDVAVDLEH